MKQFLSILIMALAPAATFAASSQPIYGWDIKCVGAQNIEVHAYQSDDDFYVDYSDSKLQKENYWIADAVSQTDLQYKTLQFAGSDTDTGNSALSLTITRNSLSQADTGTAVLELNGRAHNLNCYVRFGMDEDDFGQISSQPFPAIQAP